MNDNSHITGIIRRLLATPELRARELEEETQAIITAAERLLAILDPTLPFDTDENNTAGKYVIASLGECPQSISMDALKAARQAQVAIAIVYAPIENRETPSPYGFCPINAVPIIYKFGVIVGRVRPCGRWTSMARVFAPIP